MAKKESTILYHDQMAICRKHLNTEQIGRLMLALLEFEEGGDPEVDEDIAIAFEFMSLQASIDREKYEERCRKNRENGRLGGRPKKGEEKPKKPNGFFGNPNDNEKVNDKDNDKVNDKDDGFHDDISSFGPFQNVQLTDTEYDALRKQYERTGDLIEKVSIWLRSAKNDVPDHYALCVKFATNDDWPKRKVIEPPEPIVIVDPLDPEEQEQMVAQMRERVNGMFTGS